MKVIGVIGNGEDKFTPKQAIVVKDLIRNILSEKDIKLTSGHSWRKGVDIWAEEIAKEVGAYDESFIFPPQTENWPDKKVFYLDDTIMPKTHHCWDKCYGGWHWLDGYQSRNLKIADAADIVHVIVSAQYPIGYPPNKKFPQFGDKPFCYHCKKTNHVKSGACYTAIKAQKLGKMAIWHIIE